jgi:hypothetical protein
MKRTVMPISLSPANPDAVVVAQALRAIPSGQRSATLLRWAAAFVQGEHNEQPALIDGLDITEDELDALLDDF